MKTMPPKPLDKTQRLVSGGLLLVLIALVGLIALTANVPPVSRDALTHHLALPKLFLQHGLLKEMPAIPFSYYPMNLDLLYYAALAWGNDIIPKYIHFLFGLLTAGMIYRYLSVRVKRTLALLGALIFLSTPIVIRLSAEVYVDLGLSFFSMATMCALLRWPASQRSLRHLVLAGIWCGLALGTKYNALLLLAVFSMLMPFVATRIRPGSDHLDADVARRRAPTGRQTTAGRRLDASPFRALAGVIVFVAVALAVYAPWMIRNTVLTGNPVYPMFERVFNSGHAGRQGDWSQTASMVQDTSNTLLVRRLVFKESPGDIALIPLRIFFEGRDDDPRRFDGRLNPVLPFFILAALVTWRADQRALGVERWAWFAFAGLFTLMTFFLAPIRIRYLLPVLPALAILSVCGIFNLQNMIRTVRHPIARRCGEVLLVFLVVVMLGFNADYAVKRFQKVDPWAYLSGRLSRDAYISRHRPEYALIQHVNTQLAPDAHILALFMGERRYYFDREVTFSEGLIAKLVAEANNRNDIQSQLKKRGLTHLAVRWGLLQQWVPNNLSAPEIERFNQFLKLGTRLLYQSNGYVLLMIV